MGTQEQIKGRRRALLLDLNKIAFMKVVEPQHTNGMFGCVILCSIAGTDDVPVRARYTQNTILRDVHSTQEASKRNRSDAPTVFID